MPTYEYVCRGCGEQLEIVQSFTDDALTVCPSCSGELRKVFGNVGIVFKGSGFYKTDSRPAATAPKSAGADASTDGAKSDTSSAPAEKSAESTSPTAGEPAPASPAPPTPTPAPAPAPAPA